MIKSYLYIGAGAVVLAALGFTGRQIYNAGYDAAVLNEKQRAELLRDAADAFDVSVAKQIASIKVRNVTIKQEIQREIRENTVYRDCVASDRVFQLTNAAITGAPVPASAVVMHPTGPPD